jgi:hypothetical protein
MGLDTVIYFRADTPEPPLEGTLPNGFTVKTIEAYRSEACPEATHELYQLARYYGKGYERGPWQHIAAALMVLFATPGVTRVWYGSDCSGPAEITPGDVLELSAYYMAHGHRPYRSAS